VRREPPSSHLDSQSDGCGGADYELSRINKEYQRPGAYVTKGDELGRFEFGGSSIIVAFEPGRIKFDSDLLDFSRQRIMVDVEVGMSLGEAVKV
jgi:phosphatidylserine decarboxylase